MPPRADRLGLARAPQIRIGAVIAIAIAIGAAVWAFSGSDSSPKTTSTPVATAPTTVVTTPATPPFGPSALSVAALRKFAGTAGTPVYWAGAKKGQSYEVTRTTTGRVFVRYLPAGVAAGAPGANYLIIATYPYQNAFSALQAVSKTGQVKLPGGGIAVVDSQYTKSVHLAYPGVQFEIEVYDPSPAVARRVAVSGAVRPVS